MPHTSGTAFEQLAEAFLAVGLFLTGIFGPLWLLARQELALDDPPEGTRHLRARLRRLGPVLGGVGLALLVAGSVLAVLA